MTEQVLRISNRLNSIETLNIFPTRVASMYVRPNPCQLLNIWLCMNPTYNQFILFQ